MKARTIYHITNSLQLLILLFFCGLMFSYSIRWPANTIYYVLGAAALIYGINYWAQTKEPEVSNPMMERKLSRYLYYGGFGVLVIGFALKYLHLPGAMMLLLASALVEIAALIISYFPGPDQKEFGRKDDILDDFDL